MGQGHEGRRERGELERAVLDVLAASAAPLTPGEVKEQLPGPPAYTTVMTTLGRLHLKGALGRTRRGRAWAYQPLDAATTAARQMMQVLDRGEDRAVILAKFFDELDPRDVPVLASLLERTGEA